MKLPAASSGTFEKCPAGNHLATCYEVIELGTQETTAYGLKHQIWIGWETPNETMEDGRPYVIGKRYNFSMNEKATLRLHLESWRGKPFSDSDIGPEGSFELQNIIGRSCFLNVVHTESNGKEYANIEAVAPLPKGVTAVAPINDAVFVALNAEEFDPEAYAKVGDYLREVIAGSTEYQQLTSGKPGPTKPVDVPKADSGTDEGDESPF